MSRPTPRSRIDLHAHSSVSDGTESPADLVRAAAAAGLSAVALTDHDTVGGWDEALAAAPAGLTVVPGIEISAVADEGGRPISLHLLAYWPDPEYAPLADALAEVRASRDDRARTMVERIAAAGYDVSWEDVLADAGGAVVGRPHVARALVRAGLIPDLPAAFTPEWIGGRGARFYVSKQDLPVAEAVSLVRDSGGVPVFAHALAVTRGPTVSDDLIASLVPLGLAGLEVDHPDHSPESREHLRQLAADLGLLTTGSSDWHGGNKASRLGDEVTAPDVLDALADRRS